MDRFVNKTIEKQTIYEIYRACRLCGAGGGYKMPIIQSIVNLDGCDVELRQKIRECVQIEVQQDDKMPPLICELCVDKVNDFYEFLEMCRQTNKRTRLRLGLPPQMLPRGAPDAGDCILGITEPICVYDEDSNEPLSDKKSKVSKSGKVKKEPEKKEVKILLTNVTRESRTSKRPPSPPRLRRNTREKDKHNVTSNKVQTKVKRSMSPPPKSILKKGTDKKTEESPPAASRLKRLSDRDTKSELPAKRVKISLNLPPRLQKTSPRRTSPKQDSKSTKDIIKCKICKLNFKNMSGLSSHLKSHTVTFTSPKFACNACAEWFASVEETGAHHRRHRARGLQYRCRRCSTGYKTLQTYEEHINTEKCLPWEEVPDVECPRCWKSFPTQTLLDDHRCLGVAGRPGGKCTKCSRTYASWKTLQKHACKSYTKRADFIVDPDTLASLKPVQIRIAKCDPLLANMKKEHYDVSDVDPLYGLDKSCVYPYAAGRRVKSEPTDCMVTINDIDFGTYVHWDSDDSSDSDPDTDVVSKKRKVRSLVACTLRTIFSDKFLGKVPRKFKRVKIEKIVDSTLNDLSDLCLTDSVCDLRENRDVNDDTDVINDDKDDDDLFPKQNDGSIVSNNDFDSLFNDKTVSDTSGDKDTSVFNDMVDKMSIGANDNDSSSNDISSRSNDNDRDNSGAINNEDSYDKSNNFDIDSDRNSSEIIHEGDIGKSDEDIHIGVSNLEISKSDVKKNESEMENYRNNDISERNNEEDTRILDKNQQNEEELIEENVETAVIVDSKTNYSTHNVLDDSKHLEETKCGLEYEKNVDSSLNNIEVKGTSSADNNVLTENTKTDGVTDSKIVTNEIGKVSGEDTRDSNLDKPEVDIETKDSKESNNAVVQNESMHNGNVNIEDANLNMDDLEDFGSDSEFDDSKLMAELDAQIGERRIEDIKENDKEVEDIDKESDNLKDLIEDENTEIDDRKGPVLETKETGNCGKDAIEKNKDDKITLEDLLPKETKSTDLDSISDEEFNFDD